MLEQVLLNLIRNGMEAMSTVPETQRTLRVSAEPSSGEVIVAIADNGCGIAPDVRRKAVRLLHDKI